jgi:hypothetical protein
MFLWVFWFYGWMENVENSLMLEMVSDEKQFCGFDNIEILLKKKDKNMYIYEKCNKAFSTAFEKRFWNFFLKTLMFCYQPINC